MTYIVQRFGLRTPNKWVNVFCGHFGAALEFFERAVSESSHIPVRLLSGDGEVLKETGGYRP